MYAAAVSITGVSDEIGPEASRNGGLEGGGPGRGRTRATLIGLCWDRNSTHMRGPAQGPARIREVLHGGSANGCAEDGTDVLATLGDHGDLADLNDLPVEAAAAAIRGAIGDLVRQGARPLALGGDHAVTYPILQGLAAAAPVGSVGAGGLPSILHVDAHPDLYDDFEGNPYSHASPFARIMEGGYASRLVQVGIRTMTPHQRAQADRFGVEVLPMDAFRPAAVPALSGPVYVSIDLDGLDPAYAPGVSHHEPGGLTTRQLLEVLHGLRDQDCEVVGADVVELNPRRDPHGVTAAVAAKLVKELASLLG